MIEFNDYLLKSYRNMKTKGLLLGLLLSLGVSVGAQEMIPQIGFSEECGAKTNFMKNGARSNWFISVAGGANVLLAEDDYRADFKDRLNFAPQLSFGKWFNPYTGFRAQFTGGNLHGFSGPSDNLRMLHNKYVGVHADLLWNVTNYWGCYNEDRVFDLIPWIGVGYAHRFENQGYKVSNVPTMNAGILTAFRLSNRIDLNLEMQVAMMPEYFDRFEGGAEMDAIATLSAGLSVKLGTTNFAVIEPMDYALVNDMNNQINVLKALSNELSQRPESCPDCPELIEETIIVNNLNSIVYFAINSCDINDDQQINIYNTAEFMKSNKTPITVVGFADKDTGNAAYNLKLSEERAKAVAKELMHKYEIPSDMITVEWKGADVQPYGNNKWNRVVIMQTK